MHKAKYILKMCLFHRKHDNNCIHDDCNNNKNNKNNINNSDNNIVCLKNQYNGLAADQCSSARHPFCKQETKKTMPVLIMLVRKGLVVIKFSARCTSRCCIRGYSINCRSWRSPHLGPLKNSVVHSWLESTLASRSTATRNELAGV